ncbi:hypothetical protein M413DRAFT_419386 [Hebeloma cylindrosporum]|uniref:Wax synthase domain-containing protein n=1 Tax=Hebeloma cylindrosporum TaxID=76867 RepID=A0A0C3C3Z4_HEBCY|nr:hypothetical protein M413DRAFT_419386 [Hebeloma cylindrosporum h7]
MRGKHDLHPSYFGLCQLILLFALIHGGQPNARCNWIFFVAIFILYSYSVLFCASDSGGADFALITSLLHLIPTASDYILLRNHQPELRKIGQKKPSSEMTFAERFVWAVSLITTARGLGWAHEPKGQVIPPRPTASRRKFIASQFLWIIFYYIIFDTAGIHIQQNPCFKKGGPSLTAFGLWWRATGWAYIILLYSTMSGVHIMMSIVSVAIRLYEPGDWPHMFGSPLTAYTVRKCWGRVWHQTHRKTFTTHSNFLASALRLPKGTFTTYFKLFTSFFISGILHAGADYALHQNFTQGTSIQFFALQAVGITFEDAVIAIGCRLGYKQSKAFKLIGFIWVFAWFTFCLPIWLDPQVHAGTIDEPRVSLIRMLFEKSLARFSEIA